MLKLSNLDKVFLPEDGITKGDLLAYYRAVAPVAAAAHQGPPFTMKRYPDGIEGGTSSRRTRPAHAGVDPDAEFEVSTARQPRQKRTINVPLVNDELALLWMVNMGCIDLNTWY